MQSTSIVCIILASTVLAHITPDKSNVTWSNIPSINLSPSSSIMTPITNGFEKNGAPIRLENANLWSKFTPVSPDNGIDDSSIDGSLLKLQYDSNHFQKRSPMEFSLEESSEESDPREQTRWSDVLKNIVSKATKWCGSSSSDTHVSKTGKVYFQRKDSTKQQSRSRHYDIDGNTMHSNEQVVETVQVPKFSGLIRTPLVVNEVKAQRKAVEEMMSHHRKHPTKGRAKQLVGTKSSIAGEDDPTLKGLAEAESHMERKAGLLQGAEIEQVYSGANSNFGVGGKKRKSHVREIRFESDGTLLRRSMATSDSERVIVDIPTQRANPFSSLLSLDALSPPAMNRLLPSPRHYLVKRAAIPQVVEEAKAEQDEKVEATLQKRGRGSYVPNNIYDAKISFAHFISPVLAEQVKQRIAIMDAKSGGRISELRKLGLELDTPRTPRQRRIQQTKKNPRNRTLRRGGVHQDPSTDRSLPNVKRPRPVSTGDERLDALDERFDDLKTGFNNYKVRHRIFREENRLRDDFRSPPSEEERLLIEKKREYRKLDKQLRKKKPPSPPGSGDQPGNPPSNPPSNPPGDHFGKHPGGGGGNGFGFGAPPKSTDNHGKPSDKPKDVLDRKGKGKMKDQDTDATAASPSYSKGDGHTKSSSAANTPLDPHPDDNDGYEIIHFPSASGGGKADVESTAASTSLKLHPDDNDGFEIIEFPSVPGSRPQSTETEHQVSRVRNDGLEHLRLAEKEMQMQRAREIASRLQEEHASELLQEHASKLSQERQKPARNLWNGFGLGQWFKKTFNRQSSNVNRSIDHDAKSGPNSNDGDASFPSVPNVTSKSSSQAGSSQSGDATLSRDDKYA